MQFISAFKGTHPPFELDASVTPPSSYEIEARLWSILRGDDATGLINSIAAVRTLAHTSAAPGLILAVTIHSLQQLQQIFILKIKMIPSPLISIAASSESSLRWSLVSTCASEVIVLEFVSVIFGHLGLAPAMCSARRSSLISVSQLANSRVFNASSTLSDLNTRRLLFMQQNPAEASLYRVRADVGTTIQTPDFNSFALTCMVLPKMETTLAEVIKSQTIHVFESPGAFLSSTFIMVMCTLNVLQPELRFMHGDLHAGNLLLKLIPQSSLRTDNLFASLIPWAGALETLIMLERTTVLGLSNNTETAFVMPVIGDYDCAHIEHTGYGVHISGASKKYIAQYPFQTAPNMFINARRMHPMLDLWSLAYSVLSLMVSYSPHLLHTALELAARNDDGRPRMAIGSSTRADDMQAFLRLLFLILDRKTAFVPMRIDKGSSLYRSLHNPTALFKRFQPSVVHDDTIYLSGDMLAQMHFECMAVLHHFGAVSQLAGYAITSVVPAYSPEQYDYIEDAAIILHLGCMPAVYDYVNDRAPISLLLHRITYETGVMQVGVARCGRILSALQQEARPPEQAIIKLNNPALQIPSNDVLNQMYLDIQQKPV